MPSYVYKAKNSASQTITGHLTAQNQEEALEVINDQGLVAISIEEETSQGVLVSDIRERRIKSKELFLFTKQLSSLVKSGVTLLKALEIIAAQIKNIYFAKIIGDIAFAVKSGRSFSSCLSDYPHIFFPLYLAMIRAGEEMGQLRQVLADIADFQKRQEELTSKVNAALVYPLIMLAVGSLTVFFILTFVMPKIAVIFAGTGERLPWPTIVVMNISWFLNKFWIPIAMIIAVVVVTVNRWRQTPAGRVAIGFWLLSLPVVKDLVIKADLARFGRTMYLLLDGGLTLVRAMEVAAPTIHNPQLRTEIIVCAQNLNAGDSMGNCLKKTVYIPDVYVQVLSIAEETGSLNDALKDIAESCEADVNEMVKTMTTMLEPLMILSVGAIIAFIVFAMLLPVFSIDIMAR